MTRPTRVTLTKKAAIHQRAARYYHNLATHYDCEARDLRTDGLSAVYAECACQAHKMAWWYLSALLERGPKR